MIVLSCEPIHELLLSCIDSPFTIAVDYVKSFVRKTSARPNPVLGHVLFFSLRSALVFQLIFSGKNDYNWDIAIAVGQCLEEYFIRRLCRAEAGSRHTIPATRQRSYDNHREYSPDRVQAFREFATGGSLSKEILDRI
jgi:hypothetical protein